MQKFLEVVLVPFVSLLLAVFFRKIEVTGAGNVPADTPVIYTPNHMNSLVDGLLARTRLPREPRPLASIKLWDTAVLRPLLSAVNAIPVYRQQDSTDPAYAANNRDMFSACHEALARNACIVVFPEGESHAGSELLKLKTGVARIALGAEQRCGPLGLRIVPVGLNFDAKIRRQSIDPDDILHAHAASMDACARGLLIAATILEDGKLGRIVDERYGKWNEPKNKAMLDGKETLESIAKRALAEGLDPQPKSGRQERIEALLNSYI